MSDFEQSKAPPATPAIAWAEAILAVTFDLEEGQVVEFTYPHARYPEKLLKLVGYFSFPDSYVLTNEGDLSFCYQLKFEKEPIYCYSLYTQKKDPTNQRGYFQKSLVIISRHRLVKIFRVILKELGRLYFQTPDTALVFPEFLAALNANESPQTLIKSGEQFTVILPKSIPKVCFKRVFYPVF